MRSFEHPKGILPSLPSHIIFGQGTLSRLPKLLASYGSVRPLVVCTPGSTSLGQRCVDLITSSAEAKEKGVQPSLLAKAKMHSPVEVSDEAAKVFDEGAHDTVVAIGGGSAIGLGKALASRRDLKAFIAIPTTYSGSECTMTLGQTRTDPTTGEQLKTTSKSSRFLASAVIFDVNLTLTLPSSVTSTSAMNALAHAVEGLYAKEATEETKKLALESVAAFRRALPALSKDLDDVNARDEALYGALMGGECLGAVSMGLHHKLCHVLGGTFDMPHSPTHTVILPHATLYNSSHAPEAMAQMAEALGVLSPTDVPGALYDLAEQNGAPTSLRQLGLPESAIPRAAEIACLQQYPNPRPMEKEAIEQLLRDAWEGKRPAGSLIASEVPAAPAPSALPPDAIARALPDAVPENAPEHCPGTDSDQAGKASACEGCPNQNVCASTPKGPDPDLPKIKERMRNVKNKVLIMSGKGGVGKSTFTAMLGWACARDENVQTAIMDIDICGPSIPTILGLTSSTIHSSASGWSPVFVSDNLCAMSIGFLLPSTSSAVIWRGPKKNGLIKQFLMDVDWTGGLEDEGYMDEGESSASESKVQGSETSSGGVLDYMLIDTPPGTSDEHLSIVSYLKESGITGAVLLTTPQEVSLQDVRKEISFCRKVGVPILGVVENMAGFVCPSCHDRSDIFYPSTGGAKALCEELDLNFLGSVPLDPRIGKCCDLGLDFVSEHPESPASEAYLDVIGRVKELCAASAGSKEEKSVGA